jgi:hypothetical protein
LNREVSSLEAANRTRLSIGDESIDDDPGLDRPQLLADNEDREKSCDPQHNASRCAGNRSRLQQSRRLVRTACHCVGRAGYILRCERILVIGRSGERAVPRSSAYRA